MAFYRSGLGASMMISAKLSDTNLRVFRPDDDNAFLEVQAGSFRGLEYLPRIKAGLSALDREGSFIAERNGSIIGSVGLFKLERPDWYEIKHLAVRDHSPAEMARRLLAMTVQHVDSKHPRYLKASTPAVQPYVDVYKHAGFEPVRRSLRIGWDLTEHPTKTSKIQTRELSKELADEAAAVWVRGLLPYWDYWIEEEGGREAVGAWVREAVAKSQIGWIGAFVGEMLVGLAILRPDFYGPGVARFNGAYALPEFRGRGVGSALMNATIREAQRLNQKTMKVYTLAFLDHLAPGAVLYLKSDGRIEAEYLQLQRKVRL